MHRILACVSALAWAISAVAPLPAMAQTITYTDYNSPNWVYYDIAPTNGIRFTQTVPWVPNDLSTTLVFEGSPDYRDGLVPGWAGWQNMKWVAGGSFQPPSPTPVATYGVDPQSLNLDPFPRRMTTETTSLENVAWTAQNVTLFMRGQAMALNLQNATANFGDNHFTGGRELFAKASEAQVGGTAAINAAAGTANTISYISESISTVGVSVDVPTNASLTFSNCGRVGTTNQLVFGADGNKFDVDAGTLLLDDSTLRITQSATDSFFNVGNNGHLKLQGTGTKLNLNGGTLSIDSSQLTIDRNTSLETSGFIRLADATASMILGGRLTAQLLEADGTALITAQEEVAPHPTGGGAHVAGIQLEDNATTLTIRGTSTERAGLYFDGASSLYLQGGTLALEKATCVVDTELFLSIMKPPLLAEP